MAVAWDREFVARKPERSASALRRADPPLFAKRPTVPDFAQRTFPGADPQGQTAGAERRAAILEAAMRLLSGQSYHAVSLRRVAAEAGVALALIDHYFGAKRNLFAELLDPLQDCCIQAGEELLDQSAVPSDATAAQVAATLVRAVSLLRQEPQGPQVLRLYLSHRHTRDPDVRLPMRRAMAPLLVASARTLASRGDSHAASAMQEVCELAAALAMELAVQGRQQPEGTDAAQGREGGLRQCEMASLLTPVLALAASSPARASPGC